MWRMLQAEKPEDYVVGTGESHSVRDFLKEAFGYLGLDYRKHVRIDKRYFRPTEVNVLRAKTAKAKTKLKWEPRISFRSLVRIMVDADLQLIGARVPGDGLAALREAGINWTSGLMPTLMYGD
jgi:GDPmannose 4,6-dehydratase